MPYRFESKLREAAEGFIDLLKDGHILAAIVPDSFREYSVKLSISRDDRTLGNVDLYYSPRRNSYSLSTRGLEDKSIVPELEDYWQRMPYSQGKIEPGGYQVYVDGASISGSVGYGAVILKDGKIIEEICGQVPPDLVRGTQNVAGEIFALEKAIEWCQKNSVKEITVFHDYEGVEKWATGEWKTRKPLTQRYAELVRESGIRIRWNKVDAHTGVRWNERADELAREGAGSALSGQVVAEDQAPELRDEAEGFVKFLEERGYGAELKGIYGDANCAKIKVMETGKSIGYVNIYHTKKEPFLPRYHELREQSHRDKLDLLWREYYYGERQLPL